jgi:membrane protease YdiL (CAAX protease family)
MPIFLSYAARGLNAWWRYVLACLLGLVLAMVAGVALMIVLMLGKLVPPDLPAQLQHPTNPSVFFAATGATFAVLLAGFIAAIVLLNRKRPTDVLGRWSWRGFTAGVGLWLVVLVALTLVDLAIAPSGFATAATSETPRMAVFALLALAVQTFTEEYLFRGYLTQGLLLATKRPLAAALISGLLFGSLHIPNGWPQAVNAAVLGVVLALIAIRTGGIAFGYGLHLINNLFGAVVVVSGGDVFKGAPGLFVQNTPNLMWWDTGLGIAAVVLIGGLVYRFSPSPTTTTVEPSPDD